MPQPIRRHRPATNLRLKPTNGAAWPHEAAEPRRRVSPPQVRPPAHSRSNETPYNHSLPTCCNAWRWAARQLSNQESTCVGESLRRRPDQPPSWSTAGGGAVGICPLRAAADFSRVAAGPPFHLQVPRAGSWRTLAPVPAPVVQGPLSGRSRRRRPTRSSHPTPSRPPPARRSSPRRRPGR